MKDMNNVRDMDILHKKELEDIEDSINLVSEVFHLPVEDILWKYKFNDFDLYELRIDGKLIACRFLINFYYKGIKFSQLTDASISPSYRGKGYYKRFMKRLFEIFDTDFLFSFPNENSFRVYMKVGFEKFKDYKFKFITGGTLLRNYRDIVRRESMPQIRGIPTMFTFGNKDNYIKFKIMSKLGIKIVWIHDMKVQSPNFLKHFLRRAGSRIFKVDETIFNNFSHLPSLFSTSNPLVYKIIRDEKRARILKEVLPFITVNLADWI